MKKESIQNKIFNEDLSLKTILEEEAKELIITGRFPPLMDQSGIVLSKRVMLARKKVDVICGNYDLKKDETFYKLIDNFIENKLIVSSNLDTKFREEGMELLNALDKKYERIYSRSWTIGSHFLALDYKIEHPEVKWTAEFSDPLQFDTNNKPRPDSGIDFKDEEYLKKINHQINILNREQSHNFPSITNNDSKYYLAEYLTFLFADEIVFTNVNQRQIMLSNFPIEMESHVLKKSKISRHPTLDEEFYHIVKSNYAVNENYLNFAYFGTFYGKRHLEPLILAFEMLEESVREKIKFHIFSNEDLLIKESVAGTSLENQIIINPTVGFLEFLNLTTLMDVLIVNDTITENSYKINPYLPSKYFDYLGSKSKIWALCEKSSIMNSFDIDYKSDITYYSSTIDTLIRILDDFGIKTYSRANNCEIINHYQNRLTTLNDALYIKFRQNEYNKTINFKVPPLETEIILEKIENNKLGQSKQVTGKLLDENKEIIANATIKLLINNGMATVRTNKEGVFTHSITLNRVGTNNIMAIYNGNNKYKVSTDSINFEVIPLDTKIKLETIEDAKLGNKTIIRGKLFDENDETVPNATIKLIINKGRATVRTNEEGVFTRPITLNRVGTNNIMAIYNGNNKYKVSTDSINFEVIPLDTKIRLETIEDAKLGNKTIITGKLFDENDETVPNATIKLIINNGRATVKTNEEGIYSYEYKTTRTGRNNLIVMFLGNKRYTQTITNVQFMVNK